jgi:hypothetical protein
MVPLFTTHIRRCWRRLPTGCLPAIVWMPLAAVDVDGLDMQGEAVGGGDSRGSWAGAAVGAAWEVVGVSSSTSSSSQASASSRASAPRGPSPRGGERPGLDLQPAAQRHSGGGGGGGGTVPPSPLLRWGSFDRGSSARRSSPQQRAVITAAAAKDVLSRSRHRSRSGGRGVGSPYDDHAGPGGRGVGSPLYYDDHAAGEDEEGKEEEEEQAEAYSVRFGDFARLRSSD